MFDQERIEVASLFPATLLSYHWDGSGELNAELRRLIIAARASDPGIQTTNVGGWHSQKNLHTWQSPAITTFLERVRAMTDEMARRVLSFPVEGGWSIDAWANVSEHGHSNREHHHLRNENLLSGVYYVDPGTTEPALIAFCDVNALMHQEQPLLRSEYVVRPTPGLMLLFPSSLGHRVEPNPTQSPRVTIAFNCRHPSITTVYYGVAEWLRQRKSSVK